MTHPVQVPTSVVVILPSAGLVAVIVATRLLDIQTDLLVIVAMFVFGIMALSLAMRHPAALVAPVLFIPRDKELPVLGGLGPAGHWTALQVAGGLFMAGILLRCLFSRLPSEDPSRLHGGQTSAISSGLGTGKQRLGLMAFVSFAAIVAVSYIYTVSPSYGGQKLLGFLTLGGGLFFASFLVSTSETDLRDLIVGTALFGMVVAASSLSFSATGALGSGDNPSHIGKGQVIGLAFLLLLYSRFENNWIRLFILWLCIPILALGLVSSETRGPLFSLLTVLGMGFFIDALRSPPMIKRRTMVVVTAVLVSAVALLSTHWFYGAEASKFRYKADEIAALAQGSGQAQGTAVQRLEFYRASFDTWSQRPLIGWGVGGWSMVYWHSDYRLYPHNLFLETLVEQGLAGLAILLFFLGVVFRDLWTTWTVTTHRFPWLLPCGIYLVAIAMFSGDLDDDRFVWFWCGLTLGVCALVRRTSGRAVQWKRYMGHPGYVPEVSMADQPYLSD